MSETTLDLVDPQLAPLLQMFPKFQLSDAVLAELRGRPRLPMPPLSTEAQAVKMERRSIPGAKGDPDVGIIVYRPAAPTGPVGGILHIHGGGYVMGAAETGEANHRNLVAALGCVIVTVDYRLAPETPFPGPVEDCYAALAWTYAHAAELGLDVKRLGVSGESAGGGLAAGLALLARDRGEYPLAYQHLIYPMIDDRTCTHDDPHPHTGEHIWTPTSNVYGWTSLLGRAPGAPDVSPYAAAARAPTVAGLPPTYISTGALDLFLEEDLEYARRLTRAGVPTELHVYPGAFHAFDMHPEAHVSVQARRDSQAALKRFLA